MIYTLTVSPSLDFINKVDNFKLDIINRSNESIILAGGKGINVSTILKELNVDSTILGFSASFSGEYLKQLLNLNNLKYDFVDVDGFTRINVKIESNTETAINTDTLIVNDKQIEELFGKLTKLEKDDILIISGSIPKCLNKSFYEEVIKKVSKDVKVVVDATNECLLNTLKYHPFLIKPNRFELEEMFNSKINSKDDLLTAVNKLKKLGARNIIVSLDKYGAIMFTEDNNTYYIDSIKGEVKSTVGAGDSLIGGFIAGIYKGLDYKESFKLGLASATATTFSYSLGKEKDINRYLKIINERK